MRNSLPLPVVSARAIIIGVCTAVALMGITRHSFANVDPQAMYSNVDPQAIDSSVDRHEMLANADPLSPPG